VVRLDWTIVVFVF